MDEPQIPNEKAGQGEAPTIEKKENKSVLDEAREIRDQIKTENDRREMLMRREEEMYSRNLLAGRADAGQTRMTPEQMKKAEAQKVADEITNAFK